MRALRERCYAVEERRVFRYNAPETKPLDYDAALNYMQGRVRLGVKLGNERFCALLDRLGNPQNALRVLHIAGTKGKGSTTAMAAAMLTAAGFRTGSYLSPYVYDVRERIQLDGVPIPADALARWVSAIKPHVEELEHTEHGATTEFEVKTAIGLCWLAEQNVDYAVLEVGLGGRLDATNVVKQPLVTVITTIGFDHTELLGHTLGEIAREKAGIVKPGAPCVTGVPLGTEAYAVIAQICGERGVPLLPIADITETSDGALTLQTPRRAVTGVRLGLRGAFQRDNAAAALAALDAALLPVSDDAVRRGLASAFVPGRLEQMSARPLVIADGAHNEMAAEALADALRDEYGADKRRLVLVVGLKRNHDPLPFLSPLVALRPAALFVTEPSFQPRPATDVARAARCYDVPHVHIVAGGAVHAARAALAACGPDDVLCITGSFYTVGDIPPALWKTLLAERNF